MTELAVKFIYCLFIVAGAGMIVCCIITLRTGVHHGVRGFAKRFTYHRRISPWSYWCETLKLLVTGIFGIFLGFWLLLR